MRQEVLVPFLREQWTRLFQTRVISWEKVEYGSTQGTWKINESFLLKCYHSQIEDLAKGGARWERALVAHVLLQDKNIVPRSYGTRVLKQPEGWEICHLREYVPGEGLNQVHVRDYVTEIVEILLKVHATHKIPMQCKYVLSGLETPKAILWRGRELMRYQKIRGTRRKGVLPFYKELSELWFVIKTKLRKKRQKQNTGYVIRHGDPNPSNFIFQEHGKEKALKLIDWDYASVGLREWDLALLRLYPEYTKDVKHKILQAYQEKHQINEQVFQEFLVVGSFILSTWAAQQILEIQERKKQKQEYEKYVSESFLREYLRDRLTETWEFIQEI